MKINKQNVAYNELYLEDSQTNIAWCFEYAVRGLKFSLSDFVEKFLSFEYLPLIEKGNPHFIYGMSGVELAILITNSEKKEIVKFPYNPSENYWTGFVAAIYQWAKNISFKELFSVVSTEEFLRMYKTFHEEDIMNVLDAIDEKIELKYKLEKNDFISRFNNAIFGWRADDSYFTFAANFLNNVISLSQLEDAMKLGNLGMQFVLKSKNAFNILQFKTFYNAEKNIYHKKFKLRDTIARNIYKTFRMKTDVNGKFMIDIMREAK